MNRNLMVFACVLVFAGLTLPGHSDVSPQVVEAGKAATALVEAGDGSGSAFCVAATGYFVTNEHVVSGETTVKLVLRPGEKGQKVVTAHVIRADKDRDLALLKEDDPQPLTALPLGSSDALRETLSVTTFGFPFGTELAEGKEDYPSVTVSTGHVTALRREGGTLQDIQLDASLNPGNSGGPVLNDAGQVVGIVASGIPGAALNFAIPIDTLKALLARPDVAFYVGPIPAARKHQPATFRIRVIPFNSSLTGLSVTLALTEAGGGQRLFAARPMGDGLFIVDAVPVRAGAEPAAPEVRYRVTVTHTGKVIAEVSGTLEIGATAAAAPPKPPSSPAVLLPTIHPAAQIGDKTVLNLPALIDDVAVGGGGRYLVLSLKSLQKLAVFDFNAGRIVHYVPVDSSDYHFAVGAHSLVLILDDRKVIERWSLDTFARELVAAEPNWATVREMRMGSASAGPVVIGLRDGGTKWLNLATLAAYQPDTRDAPYGWGGAEQFPFTFRLSPDGAVLIGWVEGLSPRTVVTADFHGDRTSFHAASVDEYVGRYYTLGSDGLLVYTSVGIDTLEMSPLDPDEFGRYNCLPVQGGSFFLTLDGASPSLYTTTDKRLLLTLPKLDELAGDRWNVEKQIFLVPAANLLVTIPTARDRLILRRFDLLAQLDKSGIDYLFVASVPPGLFHKGQRYAYPLDVKSKRGGVKYILDSGPPGMTIGKTGRLEWAVPQDYAGTQESIIIRVQDASGQELYHTFRLKAGPE